MIAITMRKIIPLKRAQKPANIFPPSVCRSAAGPIPDKIIDAFKNASIQHIFSQWLYPIIPKPRENPMITRPIRRFRMIRETNILTGGRGGCLCIEITQSFRFHPNLQTDYCKLSPLIFIEQNSQIILSFLIKFIPAETSSKKSLIMLS